MTLIIQNQSNPDEEFTKIAISLRDIYGAYHPMSRSQAKKLCLDFDNFNEVILDFAGISFMGQGFAHELFVVFQNAHPSVKLTPINENDSVRKMIGHVLNS